MAYGTAEVQLHWFLILALDAVSFVPWLLYPPHLATEKEEKISCPSWGMNAHLVTQPAV
jgi:hypothetical protein